MSRITVEVWVPAAGTKQDFSIPYEVRLHKVIALIKETLKDDDNSGFTPSANSILCDTETGIPFDINMTPEELGMQNGSRVLLV